MIQKAEKNKLKLNFVVSNLYFDNSQTCKKYKKYEKHFQKYFYLFHQDTKLSTLNKTNKN
jgi:hypothetical protein